MDGLRATKSDGIQGGTVAVDDLSRQVADQKRLVDSIELNPVATNPCSSVSRFGQVSLRPGITSLRQSQE